MTFPANTVPEPWPDGVQRVATFLRSHQHPHAPRMLDAAARTARQAADALGIALGQIAKSIIFRRNSDDTAVLVITSGDRRVDEHKVAAIVCSDGARLGRADADFVKTRTGFSIGGVAPVAHAQACVTLIDRELFRFDNEIWAAAGHPHAVFKLTPAELQHLTGAPVADVVENARRATRSGLPMTGNHALAALAQLAEATDERVPSPCISVCRIDPVSGLCEGCFRTINEIVAWGGQDEQHKRGVWRLITQRAGLEQNAAGAV